jgi:hypothetical protein
MSPFGLALVEVRMSSRSSRQRLLRIGAGLMSMFLVLAAVGLVNADTGSSSAVTVVKNGLSVQVSGTWTWPSQATFVNKHYAGFAIDWGDVTSGNQLGAFHIGDGTASTNVIMQPTTPDRGTSGSWGPVSHVYAKAGSYTVCVIMYDIGAVKPFKTTGYHSLQATGPGHNTDNQVDRLGTAGAVCATFDVAPNAASPTPTPTPTPTPFQSFEGATATPAPTPTPTPFESFQGATAVATSTPPPTSTAPGPGAPSNGGPAVPLLLLGLSCLFGVVALMPVRAARR